MHRKKQKLRMEQLFPYILVAPSMILIVGFMLFPILQVFHLSVQNYDYNNFAKQGYIGLENFKKLFLNDKNFLPAVGFTLKWVLTEVGLQLFFGVILGLLLNRKFKGRGFIRSLALVPWAVSGVLTTMLWLMIFDQNVGLFNLLLQKAGVSIPALPSWLNDVKLVFPSVALAELWRGIPFFTINILAALQNVPREIYESCEIDGAGSWQKFRFITLPYLKQTIVLTTMLRFIWEFNSVDMLYTLTGGGPVRMTTTLSIYMMKTSVISGNYGYGSAIGVVVFLTLLVFAAVYMKASRFGGEVD
ncbi:MAG: sugar ABC transporter permease [Clostridiaceae bacterium]|nr:sugar ABC transporter permease [Clostridiaceae bacterium]